MTSKVAYIKITKQNPVSVLNINKIFNLEDKNPISAKLFLDTDASTGLTVYISNNSLSNNSIKLDEWEVNTKRLIDFYTTYNSYNTTKVISKIDVQGTDNDIIFTIKNNKFDSSDYIIYFRCEVLYSDNTTEIFPLKVLYISDINTNIQLKERQGKPIGDYMQSFMLLRTNPKLTGNIKLVVDSENNLYLDTFKTSSNSILNERRYRKLSISINGSYAHDVKTIFSSIPKGELFGVYNDSYNPHKGYYKIDQLKYTLYEYGAEYNFDSLYSENMKILAPLHIGKDIPEYFCIFRTDRLVNKDTYNNIDINDTAILKYILKSADIIKIFDLRQSTSIGHYLNSYKELIQEYLAGTCYLLFIEQDNDKLSPNYRQGRNSWKGISVDKGILTEKTETSYFVTKILEQFDKVLEDYNMFLLQGFERNNLLYPNILNLEFMFNDDTSNDFEFHNYFGLYLSGNTIQNIQYSIINGFDNNKLIYNKLDNNPNSLETNINNVIKLNTDNITFGVTKDHVIQLKLDNDLNKFLKNYVTNQPDLNKAHIKATLVSFDNISSFLTLYVKKPILYGEHLRFIYQTFDDVHNKRVEHIVDIIASNNEMLLHTDNNISLYAMYNKINAETDDTVIEYTVMSYYSQDLNDPTKLASNEELFKRIQIILDRLPHDIKVSNYSSDKIAFISNKMQDIVFYHITSEVIPAYDNIIPFYYDSNINNKMHISSFNNFNILIPYDLCGIQPERYTIGSCFYKTKLIKDRFIYLTNANLHNILHNIIVPLLKTSNGHFSLYLFDAQYLNISIEHMDAIKDYSTPNKTSYYVFSPFDVNLYMLVSPYKLAKDSNNYININEPVSADIQYMGIHNVKDLDITLDTILSNHYDSSTSVTIKKDDIVKIDGSDVRILPFIIYTIIDGTFLDIPIGNNVQFVIIYDSLYYSLDNKVKKLELISNDIVCTQDITIQVSNYGDINNYSIDITSPLLKIINMYQDNKDIDNSLLNIPIVPSINTNWCSNGLYFDGNSSLNVNDINNQNYQQTNLTLGFFANNVYVPGLNIIGNQYILNNIKDEIIIGNQNISIKDYILSNTYKYPIKKFLLTNKINTAIGYYNKYVQTLEFIYYGLKFVILFTNTDYTDEIKLSDYNNYQVFMLNDYTGDNVNEIYISNKEQFILIINHSFNYLNLYISKNILTMDNSSILPVLYKFDVLPFNIDLYNMYEISSINEVTKYISIFDEYVHNVYVNDDTSYIIEYETFNSKNVLRKLQKNTEPIYTYFKNNSEYRKYGIIDTTNNGVLLNKPINNSNHNISSKITSNNNISMYMTNETGNYRDKCTYTIKEKNVNNKSMGNLDEFISAFTTSDLDIYIIPQEGTYRLITINDRYKPVEFKISRPLKIKYNQGFFNPVFNDVITFDISDNLDKNTDLLLSNTIIKLVNPIVNYPCNKVYNNRVKVKQNYFTIPEYHIFNTNWDNNIYRLYLDEDNYNNVYGYTNGIIDKSLFGSKVMKLSMPYLSLDHWSDKIVNKFLHLSNYNQHSNTTNEYTISLNITKGLHDYVINQKDFVKNWVDNITNINNIQSAYNNFISLTINKIFDLNNISFLLIYRKKRNKLYVEDLINVNITDNKTDEYVLYDNYKTSYEIINNDVILDITLHDAFNYDYYIILHIDKKK